MNDKFLVIDIVFKNNKGELKDCVVFRNNIKGEESIQDKELLVELLEGKTKEQHMHIALQNSHINTGLISLHSIEKYTIKEISREEF